MKDLSRKSTSAVLWGGMELVLRQGTTVALSIILARLLAPADFGVLAMLSLFLGVAAVFVDCGFGSALIQRQNITQKDTSSVFYFNTTAALIVALLVAAAAPFIAAFYRMPILKPLTWLMAFNLFLGSFRSVQAVLLTKELNFRMQMKVTVVATIVSGGAGIVLAWRGWGVWSLAIQSVVFTFVGVLLYWILSPWRPALCFSLASLRSLFRYGSFMSLSSLLDTVSGRMNSLVIGRVFSARDLGLYSRADNIQQLPTGSISALLGRVSFPVFSAAAAGEPEALRRVCRKALTAIMLVNTPIMFGILATAQPLVHVLFGEKWLPCVPFLRVLSLAGVFWPLHVINLNLVKCRGRSDLFFRLQIFKEAISLTFLLVAAHISMMAMAWSQLLFGFVGYLINGAYSGRLASYPIKEQLRDMWPYIAMAAVMSAGAWSLTLWRSLPPALLLGFQVTVGSAAYILLCHLFKVPALHDVVGRLKGIVAERGLPPRLRQPVDISTDWREISDPAVTHVQPVVSVQMLAYNHAAFIAEAIDGVMMQQACFPIELVVGVDQSQDNTLEIVLKYQKRYPNVVRVLAAETRLGPHMNELLTFSLCRGKYLAFCEGDDFWVDPKKLARQVEILESNSAVAGCHHDCYTLNQATGVKRLYIRDRKIDPDADLASIVREFNIRTCSMVIRNVIPASELQNWFANTIATDYMLALLVAQRGSWRYIDIPMAVYRKHSGGLWSGKREVERCRHMVEFMEILVRSKEFSEATPTIAARKRDAIRALSIALVSEGRLLASFYQYLRSLGSRRPLEGRSTSSARYIIALLRTVFAYVGLESPVTRLLNKVLRRKARIPNI